jgi:hypothetical protein
MFPTIRPPHGVLYDAMQKVTLRRVTGRALTVIGSAEVQDFSTGYNAANNEKVLPGRVVFSGQGLETDVGAGLVIRLENSLLLFMNDKASIFFQFP